MAATLPIEPTLVGRTEELARLTPRVDELGRGRGALVLVGGETGVGKTMLASTLCAAATAASAVAALGRCYERGASPPFAPWPGLLDDLASDGLLDPTPLPPPFGQGRRTGTRYELLQAIAARLRQAAAARPLVLLLDDLHWADRDSLDLLELVSRRLDAAPMLVVATYRLDDLPRDHPLDELLPQLQRDRPVEALALAGLNVEDTARLVGSRGETCSEELASYLHRRTGGNPLFLTELLRDLSEQGLLPRDAEGRLLPPTGDAEAHVPAALQQVVRRRVARLGADVETFLELAAVVGQEWDLPTVEHALGWSEKPLLAAVEAALAARLVAPADERSERYGFAHGVIRDALYAGQLARRRRHRHARIASVLADRSGAGSDPRTASNAAALAYHLAAIDRWDEAAGHSLAAGDEARDRFASHAARGFYQQARAFLDRSGASADPRTALAIAERLGQTHMVLNEQGLADAEFERMLALAQTARDTPAEGRALAWLSYVRTRTYRPVDAQAAAEAALGVAERVGDPGMLATAHLNLGQVHKVDGRVDDAEQHLHQAEALARESHEFDTLGWCLHNLGQIAVWRGEYHRAEILASEALALARTNRAALYLGGACFVLGLARGELGRYETAREAIRVGLDHSEESGEPHYLVRLLNTMGWLHAELGDPETALHWDRRALDASRRGHGDRIAEAERYSLLNLATDELRLGRLDTALAWLDYFDRLRDGGDYGRFRYLNRYQILRAEVALESGAPAETLRWVAPALELAAEKRARKNTARARSIEARALLALDRPDEALRPAEEAVGLADELDHGSLGWRTRLWLARAYAALGKPLDAERVLDRAMEHAEAIAAGMRDEGLRARFLGSTEIRELRETTVRRTPVRSDSPERRPAGLTDRELEVLRLVALGRTNREIARALSISVKTVDAHVASILGKTDSPNRAAAVTFASRHALV